MSSTNHEICQQHYNEEQWVDFLLGHLPTIKRQQLELHLHDCQACRLQVEQWGQLLTEQEEFVWRKERAVEQTMDQYMEQTKALTEQRERHMRSLHREVKRLAVRYRVMKKMRQHRTVIAVAAAVLMLLALPLHGLKSSVSTVTHVDQYVQTYEPAAVSFVNASNSSRYRVEAAEGKASSGYIWLKDDWSEAFLWLENLQHIGLQDYQAWAISGEQMSSLGIIQLVGSEGHLYLSAPLLKPADFIALTIEPKGGSLSPTSKQTVLTVRQR